MNRGLTKRLRIYRKPEYVFKSCGEWMVVLRRQHDTKTNEKRKYVTDKDYAKFRGNKFYVSAIINKYEDSYKESIENTYYKDETIEYIVGKVVVSESYDDNIDKIFAPGIHYFISPLAAYYYEYAEDYSGTQITYYDDGTREEEKTIVNGEENGPCIEYSHEGYIQYMGYEKRGRSDIFVNFHENGKPSGCGRYNHLGYINGKVYEWDAGGMLTRVEDRENDEITHIELYNPGTIIES